MAQKPNPKIEHFRERVEWIVANLDPNPTYRRFVSETNDVYVALRDALEAETFAVGPQERVPGRRTWENALSKDGVPGLYLDWLYTLYPDLVPAQLEADTLEQFLTPGEQIQIHREQWRPAIRFFAERRSQLAAIARGYYSEVDCSQEHKIGDLDFPLLTQDGWIRSEPLPLTENAEAPNLHHPDTGRTFEPRQLTGLLGDYVAYKGNVPPPVEIGSAGIAC